ncbi:MAG: glutamyl-tRNA(Gln) amidotransferase subunit E [Colwellia polaris]|jgi:glutamyl-tRNA(Gln) amidotransferase subunit E
MDYENLGFKCGIEIHQQLATETKLFCNCPVDMEDEEKDFQVRRQLKSVAGESGERDEAAEVESESSNIFLYNYYARNNCLVELDEEPPHKLNQEALDTALTFARMIGANIPSEIQIMRKIVVDGSNTSGFQRTAMVGLDGELETETGKVAIDDIELEEESAGIHSRSAEESVYDLNRLGIPLVEVGTDASIQNPEHAREVAKELGMLLRSTGKARRGIGTIRQDVNVSIEDGARVEIKGFQDVENIDNLIELEVTRQKNLVELGQELEESEVLVDNVTHLFDDSDNEILSTVLGNNGEVYGFKLPQLEGKMKQIISGDRYLAKELVDYGKKYGINGLIHTDEDIEGYGLETEFKELADTFKREDGDVLAIMAGPKQKVRAAAKAVRDRAEKIYRGEVPEETRNAEQDFTSTYLRPLPGSARMYPETDIQPVKITDEEIGKIDHNLPDTLEERREKYAEEIGEELAIQITSSRKLNTFEELKESHDMKNAANLLVNTLPQLEDDGVAVNRLSTEDLSYLLDALESDEIKSGELEKAVRLSVESGPEEAVERIQENRVSEDEIREAVQEVIDEKQDMIEEQGEHAQGALMGLVMQKVEADGSTVSRILSEELQEHL